MQKFEEYISDMYKNEEPLCRLLQEEIRAVEEGKKAMQDSLFVTNGVEVKMLLQSNQSLFWSLMEYLESFNDSTENQNIAISLLNLNGIYIVKSFFNEVEVEMLLDDWDTVIKQLSHLTAEQKQKTLLNRFVFASNDQFSYAVGSEYDGKKRVLFQSDGTLPLSFQNLLKENDFLNSIVTQYYALDKMIEPNVIMAEHLYAPKYYRENTAWHIDNLSDQFKVMVILQDMSDKDAPFTYVEKTHTIKENYKDRYHKMYAINGMTTQEHNHFEDSFVTTHLAKKGILEAGDIVMFDCKIHHTATFPKGDGERKNIVLYYATVPSVKNKFLFAIDKYLNFGLR